MESSHEPNNGGATSTPNKRRHPHHHQQQHITFKTPPPPLKLSPNDTIFRLLCPATKTGRLIGKAGTIIRQLREETGARIRIEDPVANCDERVILIAAETLKKAEKEPGSSVSGEEEVFLSPGQQALVRIYDKIFEERLGGAGENEVGVGGEEKNAENSGAVAQNTVVCRILAASNQVGCVFGRGGKVVEKLRQESGTQIRVLAAREQIPLCAPPGEELIQITGSFSAVRKALLSVSNCLQDNPRVETASSPAATLGTAMPFTSTTHAASEYRGNIPEQEVVFKLLCHFEKVGNLIGKGGSVIRALKSDTGASIKILDAAPDSDERVVVISAKEASDLNCAPVNMEQNRSSAQEGVIRVQTRIAEIGSEPGAAVVARLLVPSQQIGCLMGKGGAVITEMRQVTGASIRIFTRDPAPKRAAQDDEIVQVGQQRKSSHKLADQIAIGSGTEGFTSRVLHDVPQEWEGCHDDEAGPSVPRDLVSEAQMDFIDICRARRTCITRRVGVWDVMVAYKTGQCLRQWDTVPVIPKEGEGESDVPQPSPPVTRSKVCKKPKGQQTRASAKTKVSSPTSLRAGKRKGRKLTRANLRLFLHSYFATGTTPSGVEYKGSKLRRLGEYNRTSGVLQVIFGGKFEPYNYFTPESYQRPDPSLSNTIPVQSIHSYASRESASVNMIKPRFLGKKNETTVSPSVANLQSLVPRQSRGVKDVRIRSSENVPDTKRLKLSLIIGSLKSVQDALFHITSRLRETIFPMKVSHPSNGPTNPMFRPRYDPSSPATYPSPIGFHNSDPLAGCTQQIDREPPFFHGVDHSGVTNLDQPPYHYGRNRSGHGLPFDQTPSPRSWPPQPVSGGTSRFVPDVGTEFVSGDGVVGSGSQTLAITRTTIEVVVPCTYLGSVYGENCSNLNQIIQISGAKVVVNDPRPGTTEGVVVVSGTPHQIRVAQSLIHAFILADQPF
ncbi:hypothetical protein GIB67_031873 [Kingdonia uniflora]|uniref:K Homology domain-containing protein n=1 Tax=Kingdonia uniflora TaxID=39325 RepID=A0A7J7LGM6_9MAGN|nr:hypothetical protein GIB67_031873 [Kingdonia uniflora]